MIIKQSVKSEVGNEDILYPLQRVYEKEDVHKKKFDSLEEKVDTLTTSVANLAGDIKDIQENTTVLSHHNSEHFDKDDEQDKRLDAHAKKLGLPTFSY